MLTEVRSYPPLTREEELIINRWQTVMTQAVVNASEAILPYWANAENLHYQPGLVLDVVSEKEGTGNVATVADYLSEQTLNVALKGDEILKDFSIRTEESDDQQVDDAEWESSDDPLDGTTNFLNGVDFYFISAGLLRRGRPVAAVIGEPAKHRFFVASIGKGAQVHSFDRDGSLLFDLREEREKLPPPQPLKKSVMGYDLNYSDRVPQLNDYVIRVVNNVGAPTSRYSTVGENLMVARRQISFYFIDGPQSWDVSGVNVVQTEMGCVTSDRDGNPVDFRSPSNYLAARDGDAYEQAREMVKSLPPGGRRGRATVKSN